MNTHPEMKMHPLTPVQTQPFHIPLPLIDFNFDSFPPIIPHHHQATFQHQFSPYPPPHPQTQQHLSHLPPSLTTATPPKKQLCPLCKGQKYNFTAYFHNRTYFREPPHGLLRFVEDSYVLKGTLLSLLVTYVGRWGFERVGEEGLRVGDEIGMRDGDGMGSGDEFGMRDVEVMGDVMEIGGNDGEREKEKERERDLQGIMKRIKAWEDGVGFLIERVVEFMRRGGEVDVGSAGFELEGLREVERWVGEIGGRIGEHVGGGRRFVLPAGGCKGLVLEFRRLWEGVWKEVLRSEEVERDGEVEMVGVSEMRLE